MCLNHEKKPKCYKTWKIIANKLSLFTVLFDSTVKTLQARIIIRKLTNLNIWL